MTKEQKKYFHLSKINFSSKTEDVLLMQSIMKKNQSTDIFRNISFLKKDDLEMLLKPKYEKFL